MPAYAVEGDPVVRIAGLARHSQTILAQGPKRGQRRKACWSSVVGFVSTPQPKAAHGEVLPMPQPSGWGRVLLPCRAGTGQSRKRLRSEGWPYSGLEGLGRNVGFVGVAPALPKAGVVVIHELDVGSAGLSTCSPTCLATLGAAFHPEARRLSRRLRITVFPHGGVHREVGRIVIVRRRRRSSPPVERRRPAPAGAPASLRLQSPFSTATVG